MSAISDFDVRFGQRVRRVSQRLLGKRAAMTMFRQYHPFLPGHRRVRIYEEHGIFRAEAGDDTVHFPIDLPMSQFWQMSVGYSDWLGKKYGLEGFVEVDSGDTVIDCGAFVGGFTLFAAKRASLVICVEPSAVSYRCLRLNTADSSVVDARNIGLFDSDGEMNLHLSVDPTENSLLSPDEQATGEESTVKVFTVDSLAASAGLDCIDFLKLEAEGVEPEILRGIDKIKVKKIAIDVSPEGGRGSPRAILAEELTRRGYKLRQRERPAVLFARHRDLD